MLTRLVGIAKLAGMGGVRLDVTCMSISGHDWVGLGYVLRQPATGLVRMRSALAFLNDLPQRMLSVHFTTMSVRHLFILAKPRYST